MSNILNNYLEDPQVKKWLKSTGNMSKVIRDLTKKEYEKAKHKR